MSQGLVKTCTRPGLKSCLRITPPITPDDSAASSPCNSGRTSPSMISDSGSSVCSCSGRKTVAFCSDNDLEEVFWADEWDRTPAAVTPKLSYQDILELKQLRVNLPFSPPPSSRPPFSTSKPSFPVSRFASTASHTPSKWKNRSEPQSTDVDPEILPYLDAVPIRLLPLLPQPPVEPETSTQTPHPEPHPQTPTPTASPECRPIIQPPSEPPELQIEPVSPVLAPLPPPPRPRKTNFAFVPLLPVEDPPSIPAPIVQQSLPPLPRRKFNMNFLPVNAIPESKPSSSSSSQGVGPTAREKVDVWIGTSITTSLPSPLPCEHNPSTDPGHMHISSSVESQATSLTPATSTTTFTMSPPLLSLSPPPPSSFSTASESDNDTETDTYTDTDAESDAPSVSTFGSSLPSPPYDDEGGDAMLQDLRLDPELVPPGYYPRIHREIELGSYFPPVIAIPAKETNPPSHISPTHSSDPGQTPPLSVLYPSPTSHTQPLVPLEVVPMPAHCRPPCEEPDTPLVPSSVESETVAPPPTLSSLPSQPALVGLALGGQTAIMTPRSLSQMLQKKLMLEALPSPALAPPSPFELEPHARAADKLDKPNNTNTVRQNETPTVRARLPAVLESRMATPVDSPMLTVETVRAVWDAHARSSIPHPGPVVGSYISPSISRRRSS